MTTRSTAVVDSETDGPRFWAGSDRGASLVWWPADDGWHLAYVAKTPPALVGGHAVLDVAVAGERGRWASTVA